MYSINKRYSKSAIFSPSMRKAIKPNYYQMKGRVLQQSPLFVNNIPTQMISRPYLDKLYRILKDYKYPIPSPIIPSLDNITVILDNSLGAYFNQYLEEYQFGPEELKTAMSHIAKPKLPHDYHYEYKVLMYGFYSQEAGTQANCQFHIDWHTNLIPGDAIPPSLFTKSLDTPIAQTSMSLAAPRPASANHMGITRYLVVSGGSIQQSNTTILSTDDDPWDQAYYPIVDTAAAGTELYFGYLDLVTNSGEVAFFDAFHMILSVVCTPTHD